MYLYVCACIFMYVCVYACICMYLHSISIEKVLSIIVYMTWVVHVIQSDACTYI